jgi:hypothetical protein
VADEFGGSPFPEEIYQYWFDDGEQLAAVAGDREQQTTGGHRA